MKLERIPHDPGALVELYEERLTKLGALCERTWHDRLQVIAEGRAARLWGAYESLHEIELHFAPAETAAGRDASREIFPGCPLTFQLTEALRASPLVLERFALPEWAAARPPDVSVMEKLWRAQFPETNRWRLDSPPEASFHFTLLAVARCEIQAIDQHWSLHRIAISLSDGEPDETLARDFALLQSSSAAGHQIKWPLLQLEQWRILLHRALERELQSELKPIRIRQETSLRRELERIDDYFDTYERELAARSKKKRGGKFPDQIGRTPGRGPGGARTPPDGPVGASRNLRRAAFGRSSVVWRRRLAGIGVGRPCPRKPNKPGLIRSPAAALENLRLEHVLKTRFQTSCGETPGALIVPS